MTRGCLNGIQRGVRTESDYLHLLHDLWGEWGGGEKHFRSKCKNISAEEKHTFILTVKGLGAADSLPHRVPHLHQTGKW